MLRAIIIDDEEPGIETIKMLAARNAAAIRVVASVQQAEEGITLIEDYRPDVVFLDILMPGMDGFELLEKLDFREFNLVFTTAHLKYAFQAIKNRAFDYLLKPISDSDFKTCIADLVKRKTAAETKHDTPLYVEIQAKDGVIYLKQKDIVRLEASRSYTTFYMDHGIKHLASKSLKDFEPKLDTEMFFRCHKSHIVNLQKVQKIIHDGLFSLMNDGSTPHISRTLKDELLQRLRAI